MTTDQGLEATRAVREKISREHGNDPRQLIAYYMQFQTRFADRLRPAPRREPPPQEPSRPGADAPPPR